MSRVPKWKVEKAKVKVVFRLQLHATHIPQPGWDKLFASLVPVETGKPTAKTTKANVRNGNCKWSDPIYETTRLLQDRRSRKYDEKLYKLVVAMGSSRSSLLGEVAINLAEFADASKPSSVSLPLHGCDYGTVLHVTVQLLTSKTGFREFEQQRELSVKGLQTVSGERSYAPAETATTTLEMTSEQLDKVNNASVRFKEDSTGLPSLEEVGESNEDYEDSAAGLDGSSNTSQSLYAEKNEISSMHEVDSLKSMASGDIYAFPAAHSPRIAKHEIRDIRLSKQGSNDWTHGWSSDYSADNDLTTAYDENNRLRVRLEGAEAAFLQLKTEAKSLQNLSDELGAETHNLAKQLAIELASGEKLTAEVSILKSECYKFKKELEELKSAAAMHCICGNKTPFHVTMKIQTADALSTEQNSFSNQHQVKWLQGLLLLEEKIREIQNKACLRYHGNAFDFLSSDFDVLQCILDNLRRETSSELVEETQVKEMQLTRVLQSEHFIHGHCMEKSYVDHHHHHHPDSMLHSSINSHPLKINIDATSVLEEKMCELLQKLEESDDEKRILTKKMDQMECYYEALIQELEESRHQVANEFENLKTEHSSCLYATSALQSQVEKLQQDMNEQFIRFAGDRHAMDSLNKELEEKASASETALKRVRLNYAIAVDHLQKDLELLSFQVLSMYETNGNLAKQALMVASQLFPHQNPEIHPDEQYKPGIAKFHSETISRRIDHEKSLMVNGISDQASLGTIHNFDFNRENKNIFQRGLSRNVDLCTKDEGSNCSNVPKVENIVRSLQLKSAEEEKDLVFCNEQRNGLQGGFPIFEAKYEFQSQNVESSKQLLGDNVGSEETRSSLDMLQKLQVDTEAELSQMHMLNMHWEVFTEVLKEAIHSMNDGVMHMKEEMVELARQLKDSTSEKELLILNLQSAFEDVRNLRKDEANCRSKCADLMSKNHILEARIGDVSRENSSLVQKVAEYQNKYKSCIEEKNEFEDMLKTESLQTSSLRNEIRSTVEDFKALKEEFDNQSSANSELQKTISYLQKKLGDLCHNVVSFGEEIDGIAVDGLSLKQEMESNNYMVVVLHLEQFQQEAYKKILQLHQEKKEIEEDRDITHCSLNNTEAQILNLKQRFESDLEETRLKLDLSDALVGKLKRELQDAADKLKFSLEAEERHKSANKELSSKLTILEIEIQQSNDEKRDITEKLLESDNVEEELERTKLSLMDCIQENRALMVSIESGKVVSIQLENELINLKEGLKCAHDNLHVERGSREDLEATVVDLTLQLEDKGRQLLSCVEQKSELIFLRQRVTDLETEMQQFLLNSKECQRKLDDEISTLHLQTADLEYYLAEFLDQSLSADIKVTYLRCQCQLMMEELVDQILNLKQRFESDFEETRMKLDLSDALVENLKRELQDVADKLKFSIEAEKRHTSTNKELSSKLTILEIEIQQANDEKRAITENLLEFDNVKEELERTKLSLMDCIQENRALMVSIESGKVVSIQLENEIINLKEGLKCSHDNLHVERGSREELEATVADLTLQLEDKGLQLLSCVEQKSELIFLRQRVTDLETEMQQVLLNSKECQRKLDDEISTLHLQTADLKYYLAEFLDQSLSADVKVTYLRCQCQLMMKEIIDHNKAVRGVLEELHLKNTDLVASLKDHIAIKAQFADEYAKLSTAFQSVKAELEAIVHEKEGLLCYINEKSSVLASFEDMEARVVMLESDNSREKKKYEDEICQLRNMVVSLEEEVDSLRSSKVELETTEIILKSKLDEQHSRISLLEECRHELTRLREQHTVLTYKLSEQSLKTEEFKNLSIHLRELKDKADAECLQARERREAEGSSLATQDSLRIAFIKEQCESKLQEMKNQLCASKKYAEEMLLKLQTAIDDVETGKRSEASLAKRNEELSVKISDMEAELQTVVTDRRELIKALDRMKAELECTILSLDCCKEEKLKLEASFQECSEERTRLRVELDLVKRLLENMASFTGNVEAHKNQPGCQSTTSIGEILEDDNFWTSVYQEMPNAVASCSDEGTVMGAGEDPVNNINRVKLEEMNPMLSLSREAKDAPPACGSGNSHPILQQNLPDHQDELVIRRSIDQENLLENSTKHIADVKEHFKEQQRLLTSMDLLHKELERLKNDNLSSVISLENHHLDPALQGLQSDCSHLDKANEHLGSIFPTYKEIPGSGNPLERVLALELELAESLQAKKKDICFQSSFLKQHNNDEAVFKSFRDINDLIHDMLELKRRNAAVETELKEMQGRYSQLSLQFAEVEGERQQLVMTLKNRSPRKS